MFQESKYRQLPSYQEDAHVAAAGQRPRRGSFCAASLKTFFYILSVASMLLNVYFVTHDGTYEPTRPSASSASYSGEKADIPTPWIFESPWWNTTSPTSASDALWESIDIKDGVVAIPHDEAADMGLPRAQNFPWDSSKGVYMLNSHHNLHCTKMVRELLATVRDRGHVTAHMLSHSFHCIDSFRQETLCQADDTPRFSGGTNTQGSVGAGQVRQCRDWNKVEEWARQYNACYRYVKLDPNKPKTVFQRYTNCPEGSPYKEKMERFFRKKGWNKDGEL